MRRTSLPEPDGSRTVEVAAALVHDLLSDITRTSECSPACASCCGDDAAERGPDLARSILPGGIETLEEQSGHDASSQCADRPEHAREGISRALAAIRRIAESARPAERQVPS